MRTRWLWFIPVLGALTLAEVAHAAPIRAPDFDGAVGWINSDRQLRLQDFRGKFVILDFWTLC